MTEQEKHRTPRNDLTLFQRFAVWWICSVLRLHFALVYFQNTTVPWGPKPTFEGDKAASMMLNPLVSHKEVFDGD